MSSNPQRVRPSFIPIGYKKAPLIRSWDTYGPLTSAAIGKPLQRCSSTSLPPLTAHNRPAPPGLTTLKEPEPYQTALMAWSAIEPNPLAFFPGDDPEAVPFDFVQPNRTGGRLWGARREARRNKPRRQGTRTQT